MQTKQPKTASWIIIENTTEKAIFETFNSKVAEAINQKKYTAIPAYQYLCEFNAKLNNN